MRRWYYWGVLLFAWVLQGISIYTWPKINEINREFGLNISSEIDVHTKEDLFSVILFKPFHYLVSILFTFFFLLLFRYVLKKMIYECKVAYLLRSLPYEPAALLTVGILLYGRAFYHFPYTTILFSFALIVYELVIRLPERKEDEVYVLGPESLNPTTEEDHRLFERAERPNR